MKREDLLISVKDTAEIGLAEKKEDEFLAYRQVLLQISHDLRTPAAVLKSNLQLIDDFQYKINQGSIDENLLKCQAALKKIMDFLDKIQLLNITLHPNLKPSYSRFRIKTLIHKLFNEEAFKQNGRRIRIFWNLKYSFAFSDYQFLQLILMHLLSNAIKFSNKEIILLISNSPEKLMFIIKDYGIGIPEEDQQFILNPFYRAGNARDYPGAGMGLTIVKTLVKGLGAEFFLSSKVEHGTSIKVILKHNFTEIA